MRGVEQKALFVALLLDVCRGRHGSERQSRAKGLRQSEKVRRYAIPLAREHQSGAPDAGLCLIQDQQHSALGTFLLERPQVTDRQIDQAAGAQDRLGNKGRQTAI